eukprot:jgi/Picre1/30998/NNA_006356.t1
MSGSTYQDYVKYNPGKSYYRDGSIIAVHTLDKASVSLRKCGQLCGMDWETDENGDPIVLQDGDPNNIVNGEFEAHHKCEAFILNPKSNKCVLLSGLTPLNSRKSNRYYSGYLQCPEPEGIFPGLALRSPKNVSVSAECQSFSLYMSWDEVPSALGYLVSCITEDGSIPQNITSTRTTILSIESIPADTLYRCFVSSYSDDAISRGSPADPIFCNSPPPPPSPPPPSPPPPSPPLLLLHLLHLLLLLLLLLLHLLHLLLHLHHPSSSSLALHYCSFLTGPKSICINCMVLEDPA